MILYPKIVCYSCYLTLRHPNRVGIDTELVPPTWLPRVTPFLVCNDATAIPRGSTRKIKAKGRPRDDGVDHQRKKIVHHLHTLRTYIFSNDVLHLRLTF